MIFVVEGKPVSQGSMRAFNRKGGGQPIVTSAKKGLAAWRKDVADAAREAWGDQPLIEGPVRVRIRFMFERPASHFFTRKSGKVLRPDAPLHVTSHQLGDLDKHVRSIFDALTGVTFKDDSQVSSESSEKVYGGNSCAVIEVTPLKD